MSADSVIRVLPMEVANRIAAGEVVERPASVVKELVENALDAGARNLLLELEDGGVRLVRVGDDGSGMSADDLARCVLPHATSKIADVDDLFRVATFGFRGEALPSIASVSELEITTRRASDPLGSRLRLHGGGPAHVLPAGAPAGTIVEVRNLFFNVPARRKFLKQERTELSHCVETITRLLLAHPEVAARVTHQGRKVLEVRADADPGARIRALFGAELAERLLPVRAAGESLRLEGFVGVPALVRTNSEHQYFFLNGRFIRDRNLSFALKDAYRDLIVPRDFPVGFVFLSVDPRDVDVNVHPTKIEVRFRDRDAVVGLVRRAVRERVLAAPAEKAITLARPSASPPSSRSGPGGVVARIERELFSRGVPAGPSDGSRHSVSVTAPGSVAPDAGSPPEERRAARPEPLSSARGGVAEGPGPGAERRRDEARREGTRRRARCHEVPPMVDPGETGGNGGHVLQLHRSYLVAEDRDGLCILDQHALHERRLFEEILARATKAEPESQRLLVPEVVELSATEKTLLLGFSESLRRLGLEVAEFGGTSVAVYAQPLLLGDVPGADLVDRVLGVLREEEGQPEAAELLRATAADLACRGAVKFGTALPAGEIDALVGWWRSHPEARTCPHGRPIAASLSLRELELHFLRKR